MSCCRAPRQTHAKSPEAYFSGREESFDSPLSPTNPLPVHESKPDRRVRKSPQAILALPRPDLTIVQLRTGTGIRADSDRLQSNSQGRTRRLIAPASFLTSYFLASPPS